MDIYTFLKDNVESIIGFVGVIVGATLTLIPIIIQRRWHIDDEKREWRRNRLLYRLSPVQEWLDSSLRFAHTFADWYWQDENNEPAKFLHIAENDLNDHMKDLGKQESVMLSHVMSTGDDELFSLIRSIISIRIKYVESLQSNDMKSINTYGVSLDATVSKAARRIEYLLEEAKPVGGPYHNKSFFRFLRRKK